jgi:hypothetical protein
MVHCCTGGGIKKLRITIATLIGFLLAGATIPTLAAERRSANIDERAVADFYRGKVVRIVVGFPPGGGAESIRGFSSAISDASSRVTQRSR